MSQFKNIHWIFSILMLLSLCFPDTYLRAATTMAHVEQEFDARKFHKDSLAFYKAQSIDAAQKGDVETAGYYAETYVKYAMEPSFLDASYFQGIQSSDTFQKLRKKYLFHFNSLHFFYLFSALIGFFIGLMVLLKKGQDRTSGNLIGLFLLMHSIFIFHIFLHNTNLAYQVPHTLYMSAIFSYLYGPLIYLYFKRVTLGYRFKKLDLLHLLPTFILVLLMLPSYALPVQEKLKVMFHVSEHESIIPLLWGVITKTISLAVYGFLVWRLYFKIPKDQYLPIAQKWLNTLVLLAAAYVVSYVIYGMTITNIIPRFDFLYHLQIIAMSSMVLYIGYASFQQPHLFSLTFGRKQDKYVKSGLTTSYSVELKDALLKIMEEEKVYLKSDVSLDLIAEKLGTNRHNASQVINEHFGLNFFEFINKYRIQDAVEILEQDKNCTIIDVAYQVGFNNKVTFNKSFKKLLSQTPTQYLSSL